MSHYHFTNKPNKETNQTNLLVSKESHQETPRKEEQISIILSVSRIKGHVNNQQTVVTTLYLNSIN